MQASQQLLGPDADFVGAGRQLVEHRDFLECAPGAMDFERSLERGENHWAYISGLSSSSNSMWPLIVDHTDGSGFYTDKETEFGGTWKGAKTIVVRADISAAAIKLIGTGSKRFMPRFDDRSKNALDLKDYMGDGAKLLEPAR